MNDLEIVPLPSIISGITSAFTFYMLCISVVRFLHFRIFSASFFITFLSHKIATYISIPVPFFPVTVYDICFLLRMVLPVCTCSFHNMVILPS